MPYLCRLLVYYMQIYILVPSTLHWIGGLYSFFKSPNLDLEYDYTSGTIILSLVAYCLCDLSDGFKLICLQIVCIQVVTLRNPWLWL